MKEVSQKHISSRLFIISNVTRYCAMIEMFGDYEVKIAVLDWPYYYRVRVLENFTIPLTPLRC